jgi:hypothetical protein
MSYKIILLTVEILVNERVILNFCIKYYWFTSMDNRENVWYKSNIYQRWSLHVHKPCSRYEGNIPWEGYVQYLHQYHLDIHYESCYATVSYTQVCWLCVRVIGMQHLYLWTMFQTCREICHRREMAHISTNTTQIFIIQAAISLHYTPKYAGYVSGSCPQCIHVHKSCSGHGGNVP